MFQRVSFTCNNQDTSKRSKTKALGQEVCCSDDTGLVVLTIFVFFDASALQQMSVMTERESPMRQLRVGTQAARRRRSWNPD